MEFHLLNIRKALRYLTTAKNGNLWWTITSGSREHLALEQKSGKKSKDKEVMFWGVYWHLSQAVQLECCLPAPYKHVRDRP